MFSQENSPEPVHSQSPTRYLKKLSAKCGVPDGADVASVSEALGHSDKAVTLRMYTHTDAESRKRAAQIFRDAIKKAGENPRPENENAGQDTWTWPVFLASFGFCVGFSWHGKTPKKEKPAIPCGTTGFSGAASQI